MDGMESLKPLPAPFKVFEENEALFYRGAVTLLAGGPGSMKTISTMNFVRTMKVPTLYFSNDSTAYTIITRAYAMLTKQDIRIARGQIERDPGSASRVLSLWGNVRFEFNSKPSIEDLAMSGEAFHTLYGEYPHFTVVDVLMNVDHEGVPEQNYWRLMPELKAIASDWNTAMFAVHHTTESVKGEPCQPMSAILGKANQLPELIITTHQGNYAVVKNRNGKSDVSGRTTFRLDTFPSQSRMEDAAHQEPSMQKVNLFGDEVKDDE